MKQLLVAAVFVTVPFAARADDSSSRPDEEVRAALEDRAEAPPTPPELPTQASDQARKAHAEIAFGQRGAAMREAHSQAQERGEERARIAREQAQQHANGAAANARADEHRAAAQGAAARDRAEEARGRSRSRLTETPSPRR